MYVFHTQNFQFSGGAIVPKNAFTNAQACSLISINCSLNQKLVSSQATHSWDRKVSLTAHCEILPIPEPEVRTSTLTPFLSGLHHKRKVCGPLHREITEAVQAHSTAAQLSYRANFARQKHPRDSTAMPGDSIAESTPTGRQCSHTSHLAFA